MAEYQIDNIALRHWSSRSMQNPGVALAGIYLFEGDEYRGYAYFYAEGTELKRPSYDEAAGRIYLHFNISQYANVLDALRSESPVTLYFNSYTDAGLRCGKDPFAPPAPPIESTSEPATEPTTEPTTEPSA